MEPDTYWSDWYYDSFRYPIAYSGGLLIGASFIREMYVHMGHHPAFKYREVHELVFEDGRLLSVSDRSAQMAEFRDMIADRPRAPMNPNNRKEIEDWIEQAFSRDYK